MIGGALIGHLRATAGISSLVSARAWFKLAPSTPTLPYIVSHDVLDNQILHCRGASGIARGRYQFNCYGATAASAKAVADAVKTVFEGWVDPALTLGTEAITIDSAFVINEIAPYEQPESNQNLGIFNHIIESEIWYRD